MSTSDISISRDQGVLALGLNRPQKLNSITREMYATLAREINGANGDDEIGSVLIYGEGDDFTSGNDLNDFLEHPPTGDESPVWHFLTAIRDFSKPLVAAISGRAVGVGVTMLFHCDYVIAGRNSKLSMPFVNLGLVPEAGSSYLLPLIAGHQRAAEMFMLGEVFSAQRGYEAGFINEVVDEEEVAVRAGERAKHLADQPRTAIRETKRLLRQDHKEQLTAVMAEEARLFTAALASDEAREAFMKFLMKRGK
ncbi:MAG: enoyl-CoA hydratase [Actinobacteria bacterium]|nr:enoyl-CoA hydratase [Actinomycetota bacterium]